MNKILVRALILGLGALLPAACSSSGSSSSTSTGTGPGSCDTFCEAILAVGCANDTAEGCEAECTASLSDAGECSDELQSLYGCAVGLEWTCSEDGTADVADDSLLLSECGTEYVGMFSCMACEPAPDDDACATCQKSSCCAEFQAVYGDAEFPAYLQCVNACMDQTCYEACQMDYPNLLAKQATASQCVQAKCANSCN